MVTSTEIFICNADIPTYLPIVCIPPLSAGGLNLLPNFQKGGLTGPQLLDGGWWERGGDFFHGECNFYVKDKSKSEIFINKNIFLCHN